MGLFHHPLPELAPVRQMLHALLVDIGNGSVRLRRVNSLASVHVEYETSDGWRLCIFNDCGYWDYMQMAIAPDGRTLDFDEIQGVDGIDWNDVAEWRVWGAFLNYGELDEG